MPARRKLVIGLFAIVIGFRAAAPVGAITPEDPKVRAMIDRAVTFLESGGGSDAQDFNAGKLGGVCLAGMVCYKHRYEINHPQVQKAIAMCREVAANPQANQESEFNYSLGIAIIFLCETDPEGLRREIETLISMMLARQNAGGYWTYPTYTTGDTSQTQYGALSTWVARKRGFQIPDERVEAFGNWLIRTQDPSGRFAYQGTDSGSNGSRVAQPNIATMQAHSYRMFPAALGSLYIAADLLKIPVVDAAQQQEVFRKVTETGEGPSSGRVDPAHMRKALQDGNQVYDASFRIEVPPEALFQYYYMYSVERYHSLREAAEKRVAKEPTWYAQGVDFLARNQQENGSWTDNSGAICATSFATLFLMRATKKIIASEGALVGGYGLPADLTRIKLDGGNIVSTEVQGDLGSLMEMIQKGEAIDNEALIAQIDHIQFETKRESAPSQTETLKKMVAGENYQARILAVRALANTGDFENVPVLIYALSDPDWRVAKEARDGLRHVTRRISGFGMPDKPTPEQQRAEQIAWRDWIATIKPDMAIPDDVILEIR
ncbi:MAG: hypothetical protein FJ297_06420 [Planctomycetes bacterium]|nr:hypothetical protein [Planctomycetota bacterium]